MSKILVTGGAGFIGFHVINRLIEDGHIVCSFDSYNDYYDQTLKYARADQLSISVPYGDLKDAEFVEEYIGNHKPDVIIHLAGYAGVRHSLADPQKYIDNNVTGTQNLINASVKHGVDHVLYASTSSCMVGNPLPWTEDDNVGRASNPYAMTKVANESQFACSKIKNTTGLRFFTVYGPWGRPDMALFDFANNIVKGNPITLYNHGDMTRDFTYIDDIVNGIVILVNNTISRVHPEDMIYNIGYGQQVKLTDFVDHIEINLGKKAKRILADMHPADAKDTWSDTAKIRKLGYSPSTPLPVGVEKFMTWYKGYYNVN